MAGEICRYRGTGPAVLDDIRREVKLRELRVGNGRKAAAGRRVTR